MAVLTGLGPDDFEQMCQALAVCVLGPGTWVFGDGPDGGREATFDGPLDGYPSRAEPWNGYIVLQAKHKAKVTDDPDESAKWLAGHIKAELDAWSDPTKKRVINGRLPEYLIIATNVSLSAVPGVGGKDKINKLIRTYTDRLGLRGWQVWDEAEIITFLHVYPNVRRAFRTLTTSNEVFAALLDQIEKTPRVLLSPTEFWYGQTALPGREQPLVGREVPIAALRDALASAAPDQSRIVVVEGTSGVGKTRLALDVADEVATTLVARAGAMVDVGHLIAVPSSGFVVVVVDDVQQAAQLRGIVAMMGDPRFDHAKIILTMLPGVADQILAEAGLLWPKPPIISLGPLSDAEIDRLVTDYKIVNDEFRLHVAAIAGGSPFVAHAACELARDKGFLSWSDSSDLLRGLFEYRLARIPNVTTEHRAAALALAALTQASNGESLARLAGAITALATDTRQLDRMLVDLAQAGIAATSPYALHPMTLRSVVVADALRATPAKINIGAVLAALGVTAFGSAEGTLAPGANATMVATQFAVLAQAAHQANNRHATAALHHAVHGLVSTTADMDTWRDALILAGAVAPFSTRLLDQLRQLLVRQWPPDLSETWWSGDPDVRVLFDFERLLRQAGTLAEQVGAVEVDRAVSWLLDVAWLVYPLMPAAAVDVVRRAIAQVVNVRQGASTTLDELFARRDEVRQAVAQWSRERRTSNPVGLAPDERLVRDSMTVEEVSFAALRPLLSVVTEGSTRRKPGDDDVLVWSQHLLPEDQRIDPMLEAAASEVREMLRRLDPSLPAAKGLLDGIARLPFNLRGEGARGLSGMGPLPEYARQALATAAEAIASALAERWADLPAMVRHTAAEYALKPAGRPSATLDELAAAGDPIGTVAITDTDLVTLAILLPLNENQSLRSLDDDQAAQLEQSQHEAAEQLAMQLPLNDGLALLGDISTSTVNSFRRESLAAFARALGRNTQPPDVTTILSRLAAGSLAGDFALLDGLAQSHPEAVDRWLNENRADPSVVALALGVVSNLEPMVEIDVFDAALSIATADTTRVAPEDDDLCTSESHNDETTDHKNNTAGLANDVARRLAWSLIHGREAAAQRLHRLATLGADCASVALPAVLGASPALVSQFAADDWRTDNSANLRRRMVNVLGRGLAESDEDPYAAFGYDAAAATVALVVAAPEELADLLVQRILDEVTHVLPHECDELLASSSVNARGPALQALSGRIDRQRQDEMWTEQMETTAERLLFRLGAESDDWFDSIRHLAAGTADDRARAARLIKDSWRHPAWLQIVPELLDAGLDDESTTVLHRGLLGDTVIADLSGQIALLTDVLGAMSEDPRVRARRFAREAMQDVEILRDF